MGRNVKKKKNYQEKRKIYYGISADGRWVSMSGFRFLGQCTKLREYTKANENGFHLSGYSGLEYKTFKGIS